MIFDAFKVGRYESTELDGCPDGYMQLSELGRPFTGGSWCGSSTGYAVYYSETSTITVSVKLFHSPQSVPFEFHLRYKFVSQLEAVVRFGSPAAPLERGQVSPGTYCTRQFDECRFKPCRLQSPNYPGMYPRNVTCYWSLHQKEVPTCKHAMIAVKQESAHKMHMKRSISMASLNKTGRALRAWRECTGERDHLIFYDGPSTNDPVLVKYCGGDWLPRVVSHGPWMLVAFHSSPFSIPLHSNTAHSPLRGFELDVDVIFADSDSLDYSRESRRCEFHINATSQDDLWEERGRKGRLLSPRHTLPPNTTCTWKFHGQPGDLIWIYFVSYSHRPLLQPPSSTEGPDTVIKIGSNITLSTSEICTTRLRIWDGAGHDARLMADHCDDDLPKLCDHYSLSNHTRITRPCLAHESYVSSSSKFLIEHHTEDGTALHPASFRLRYEFVDTRLGGDAWLGRKGEDPPPQHCSRVFRKMRSGEIFSPRNVFLYGRGGATNLTCVYRLEAGPGEKVRLMIHNVSFGENTGCQTEPDPHTARPRCIQVDSNARTSELRVFEVPWRDTRIPRACLCDNFTLSSSNPRPLVFLSSSRFMELHFTLTKMNITEDFRDLYFFATFEMIRMPECPRRQRLRGSGGEVEFNNPPVSRTDMYCEGLPWLVEAHENRSLFLLTWGTFLPLEPSHEEPARCPSKNRVLIYSGKPARLIRVVCPAEPNARQFAVHVFSEEWFGGSGESADFTSVITYLQPPRPPSFLVECVSKEPGVAAFNWLEISRSRSALLQQLQMEFPGYNGNLSLNDSFLPPDWECPHRCPELDACISSSLWCDGRPNCPSGYDENEVHCGVGRRFFKIFPGGIYTALSCLAAVAAALLLLLVFSIIHRVRTKRRRRRLGKKKLMAGHDIGARRVMTEDLLLDPGSTISS